MKGADPREDAEGAHGDGDEGLPAAPGRARGEGQEAADVGDGPGRDGDLRDVGALPAHAFVEAVQVVGRPLEVVVRHDEPAPGFLHHHVQELAAVLDVHEVVAALHRLEEDHPALRVVVVEAPALAHGTAGEDQRARLRPQDRQEVEVQDEIPADLEQVGEPRELGHAVEDPGGRLLRQRHADLGHGQ